MSVADRRWLKQHASGGGKPELRGMPVADSSLCHREFDQGVCQIGRLASIPLASTVDTLANYGYPVPGRWLTSAITSTTVPEI